MIQGIGNDIIEIKRVDESINKFGQKFLDKVFTLNEQIYCKKYNQSERHFAGRFAAKEAIVKALGTGFRNGITWLDIEILNDANGKPSPLFSESLTQLFPDYTVLVSISHCKEYASAAAICMKKVD